MTMRKSIRAGFSVRLSFGLAVAFSLSVASLIPAVDADAAGFSNGSVKGAYSCSSNAPIVSSGSVVPTIFTELGQLNFDGKGNVTSGSLKIQFETEVCLYTVTPAGSTYTVTPDGVGTLSLNLTAPTNDVDSDFTCASSLGSFQQNSVMVIASHGTQIKFSGNDPEFVGGIFATLLSQTESGDYLSFFGTCNKQ
jgi:hypothetical protein